MYLPSPPSQKVLARSSSKRWRPVNRWWRVTSPRLQKSSCDGETGILVETREPWSVRGRLVTALGSARGTAAHGKLGATAGTEALHGREDVRGNAAAIRRTAPATSRARRTRILNNSILRKAFENNDPHKAQSRYGNRSFISLRFACIKPDVKSARTNRDGAPTESVAFPSSQGQSGEREGIRRQG